MQIFNSEQQEEEEEEEGVYEFFSIRMTCCGLVTGLIDCCFIFSGEL